MPTAMAAEWAGEGMLQQKGLLTRSSREENVQIPLRWRNHEKQKTKGGDWWHQYVADADVQRQRQALPAGVATGAATVGSRGWGEIPAPCGSWMCGGGGAPPYHVVTLTHVRVKGGTGDSVLRLAVHVMYYY